MYFVCLMVKLPLMSHLCFHTSDMVYCGVYDNALDNDNYNLARGFNYHQGPVSGIIISSMSSGLLVCFLSFTVFHISLCYANNHSSLLYLHCTIKSDPNLPKKTLNQLASIECRAVEHCAALETQPVGVDGLQRVV